MKKGQLKVTIVNSTQKISTKPSIRRFKDSNHNFIMALIDKMDKTDDPIVKQALIEAIEARSPFKKTQQILSLSIFKMWSLVITGLMIIAIFDSSGEAKYIMGQIMYVIESKTFWIPVSAVLGTYFVNGILEVMNQRSSKEKEVVIIEDGKVKGPQ